MQLWALELHGMVRNVARMGATTRRQASEFSDVTGEMRLGYAQHARFQPRMKRFSRFSAKRREAARYENTKDTG